MSQSRRSPHPFWGRSRAESKPCDSEIAKRASASTVLIVSTIRMEPRRIGERLCHTAGFVMTNSHVLTPGRMGLVHARNSDEYLMSRGQMPGTLKMILFCLRFPVCS